MTLGVSEDSAFRKTCISSTGRLGDRSLVLVLLLVVVVVVVVGGGAAGAGGGSNSSSSRTGAGWESRVRDIRRVWRHPTKNIS